MIRTTSMIPFFGKQRNGEAARSMVRVGNLTTLRHEPILRAHIGYSHLDMLFEAGEGSLCVTGVLLDGIHLITREQSPIVWPAVIANTADSAALAEIATAIVPWLRAQARARATSRETIRRYAPSVRFDRAREADLFGAAPLERALIAAAPFVYARRFARGECLKIAASRSFLALAMLYDIADAVDCQPAQTDDERFVRDWFGLPDGSSANGQPHGILVTDDHSTVMPRIIITDASRPSDRPKLIDVPKPCPWDVVYPFDRADAPVVATFAVNLAEPALRDVRPAVQAASARASSGVIILALSPDARVMRADDERDAAALRVRLEQEGFTSMIVTAPTDTRIAQADIVHIFGAPDETHVAAFAHSAREHGVAYIFDLPPFSIERSRYLEKMLPVIYRSKIDDADIDKYIVAYGDRRLEAEYVGKLGAAEIDCRFSAFAELAQDASALLTPPCNLAALRSLVGANVGERLISRGSLDVNVPPVAQIGHLVPRAPYAFVDAAIGSDSHALFAALALDRAGIPAVVAGAVYDVDYLATLRLAAPSVVILADPQPGIVAALYRSATFWLDAAPHPRGCSSLLRAVECGALPILADQSPLTEIAGDDVPVFSLVSVVAAAQDLSEIYADCDAPDRAIRLDRLTKRLALSNYEHSFGAVIAAYTRAAVPA